ncbi:hypothetical protein [Lentzea jiangxiensis]|uniref:Uncharacterized protein n=1 Tax=Lentzea jiangxiensis TaxID=641025 RepID=A0A1H0JQ95_9PSEU|nr:hypothetical protein [Lentzea jiangxiensis]SDO45985.1 hypothetical protein SAMN05421507_102597 [Lentzea jiangxiensis]
MIRTLITKIAAVALAAAALTTVAATTAHAVTDTAPVTASGSNPWE